MKPSTVVVLFSLLLAGSGGWMAYEATRVKTNDVGLDFSQPKHFVTAAMELETKAMGNRLEPTFAERTELGAPIEIAPHNGARPQFILFIKDACPCSIDAQPLFNRLAQRFNHKVQFVGVIDGDRDEAKKFAAQFSVAFPVVGDQNLEVIKSLGAQAGVYSALIARSGHLVKMWPGYSAELLKEMNHDLAVASGCSEFPFDPQYAPIKKTTGCAYPSDWSTFK